MMGWLKEMGSGVSRGCFARKGKKPEREAGMKDCILHLFYWLSLMSFLMSD